MYCLRLCTERKKPMAKRILLVDNEPLIIKGLKYTLEQEGFETDSAADGEEALNKFFSGHFDFMTIQAGYCYVVFPEDGHMPGVHLDTPADFKKAVVKLKV